MFQINALQLSTDHCGFTAFTACHLKVVAKQPFFFLQSQLWFRLSDVFAVEKWQRPHVPSSFPNGVCRPPPLFQTRQRWRRQVRKRRLAGDFCFSPLIRPQPRVKLSGDLLVIKLNVTKLAEPKDRWSKQVQHDWQLVRGTPACSRSHAVQRRGLISPDGGAGLCGSSQWERHECILKSRIKQHALAPLTLTIFTVKWCKQSRPFFLKLIMRWLCGACGEVVHFLWGGGGGGFRRKEPH